MPIPYPYPLPPNKKLIGFGSFEKVNLKLAGGSGPLDPPPPASYDPVPIGAFVSQIRCVG